MSNIALSVKRSGIFQALSNSPILGPMAALLLAIFFFSFQSDRFLTSANLSLVIQQVMVVGALAIGQTIIILTTGIDLSCGMIMAFSSIMMTDLAVNRGIPPLLAIFLAMLVSVGFGFLNGFLVTVVRLPAFIVTLGTFNIAYASTFIYTSQSIPNLPHIMTALGDTFRIGSTEITYGSVVLFGLYVLMWFILRSTVFGRQIYAVGDNPEAARLAGIPTARLLIAVYMLAGFFYSIAALFVIARIQVGDPRAGDNLNLEAITAVVLGGTSLFGGRGAIFGTLIGAITVGVFRNGLQLMGVPSIFQVLITGMLVILAVSVDALSRRGK
ncbi:MAG: ABC transporter permease [Anaerolineaceae bacterium]|nr:ABC transporter permease [Anaerolineaceae bacterium]